MNEEIKFFHLNKTLVLVIPHSDKIVVDCKWIYKVKEGITKSKPFRFKARLVAKRFT